MALIKINSKKVIEACDIWLSERKSDFEPIGIDYWIPERIKELAEHSMKLVQDPDQYAEIYIDHEEYHLLKEYL